MNQKQTVVLLFLICGVLVKECTSQINWVISDAIRGAWEQERSKNAAQSDEIIVEETEEVENVPLIRGPCFTKCSIAVEDRRRCGYTGTSKSKCIRKKCCWDDDESIAVEKRCYRKEIGICDNPKCATIGVKQRITCLAATTNPNVTHDKAACIRAECCWDETVGNGMCFDMKTTKASKKTGTSASTQQSATTTTVASTTTSVFITSTEIPVINNITVPDTATTVVSAAAIQSSVAPVVSATDAAAAQDTAVATTADTKTTTTTEQALTTTESAPVSTSTEAVHATTSTQAVQSTTSTDTVQATTSTDAVQSTSSKVEVPTTSSGSRFQVTVSTLFPDPGPTITHHSVPHTRPKPNLGFDMFGGHQTTFPQLTNAGRQTTEFSSTTHHPVRNSIAPTTSIPATSVEASRDDTKDMEFASTGRVISFQHHSTTIPPLFPKSVEIETDDSSSVKTGSSDEPDFYVPRPYPDQVQPYIFDSTILPQSTKFVTFSTNPVFNWIPTTPKPSVFFVPTSPSASKGLINPPVKDSDLMTYTTGGYSKTQNPLAQQIWNRNMFMCVFGDAKLCKLSIVHGMSIKPTNHRGGVTGAERATQPVTGQQGQTERIAQIASQPPAKKASPKPVDDVIVAETSKQKNDIIKELCKLAKEVDLKDPKWDVTCRALKVAEETAKKPLPSLKDIERGMLTAPGISAGTALLGAKPPAMGGNGRNFVNLVTSNSDVCLQQRLFQTGMNYPLPCYTSKLKKVDTKETCLSLGCCWKPSAETIVLDRLNMPHNKLSSYILSNTIGLSDDDHVHCIKPLSLPNVIAMYWMSYNQEVARIRQQQRPTPQAGIYKVDATAENEVPSTPQTSPSYGCNLFPFGIHVSCGDDIADIDSCFARSCCWLPQLGDGKTKCFLPRDASR